MKFFDLFRLLALTLVAVGICNNSFASHIDFFDDAGFFLAADSNAGSNSDTQTGAPGNILQTEREVDLSFASGTGFIATGVLIPPGELLFVNSVNSLGTLTLTYDGVGSGGFAPPEDFDSLWNFITVNMTAVQGSGNLTVAVTDSANNTGSLTGAVVSAGTYSFPFSNAAYSGVDFSSVSRVVVTLETTTAASDFSISQITREESPGQHNIPEPAALFLTAFGLVAAFVGSRLPRG